MRWFNFRWRFSCLVALVAWGAARASGQQSDRELIQQLLNRVQQLEKEVRDLRSELRPRAEPTAAQTPAAAPVKAEPSALVQEAPSSAAGGLQFRGFSDVYYRATNLRGETNSFALGQFNLFITSKLSDRWSVLAETVLEADTRNQFGFELERLLLQFAANDYFSVGFGRYHTAIGFYNTAYHHSSWMQTAVGRPILFAFEDEGGILPIHNVGLTTNGRIRSGRAGLHYVAEFGNGRASRTPLDEPVQNVRDENNRKSYNLGIYARPEGLRGFQAGVSVYRDRLYPLGQPRIDETIVAGHAVYQSPVFEWLNEAVLVRHALPNNGPVYNTNGWYSQVSRRFRSVRPYFRYQYLNAPSSEPIHGDVGRMHGPSIGFRWDFSEFAAFKAQYDRAERRRLTGINEITTQLSFTF